MRLGPDGARGYRLWVVPTLAILLPSLLSTAQAAPPASGWAAPTGLDSQSPLRNCDQARAAGTHSAICGWKLTSDIGATSSLILGGGAAATYTLLLPSDRAGRLEPAIAWAGGLGVALATTQIVKTQARRPRPYTYDSTYTAPAPTCRGLSGGRRDDCWSFFSGHTNLTAFNLFYAASALDLYSTGPARRPAVAVLGYTVATVGTALVGTARVEAGQHFWSDVIVGGVVGAGIGLASPRLTHLVGERLGTGLRAQEAPLMVQMSGSW